MACESDPAVIAGLQAKFAHFARHVFADDPFYRALTAAAAARADWAALLAAAPSTQRLPILWLAALQDRVFELVELGQRPALADYYASVGDARAPDAPLATHLGDFIERERDELLARIATRTTQTNEIGRCAVLWPILRSLVDQTRRRPLALLDVGCSAGLNLGVDQWRYRHVDDANGAPLATTPSDRDPRAPEIACRVLAGGRGRLDADTPEPRIVSRLGIDLNPVPVDDAAEVRWLRACLWPSDGERRARLDAAVAIARTQHWPLAATADAAASIARWIATLPADVTPVIFNSWVLSYFDAPLLGAHVASVLEAVAQRGAVWISAEDPTLSRSWWPGIPQVETMKLPNATAWTVARPDGHGGVAWTLAAVSHAHGRWMLYEGFGSGAGR